MRCFIREKRRAVDLIHEMRNEEGKIRTLFSNLYYYYYFFFLVESRTRIPLSV